MENAGETLRYLTIVEILRVAEKHVGSYQLLNENQLHYLVEIVSAKLGDTELFPTLPQKAAVYAHHIITGHLFSDGNKRIGLTCALAFLVLNGCSLHRDIDDLIIDLGFNIADGTITDLDIIAEHLQSWIQR
ncbi:type II toxin-antitoxin system death-on-curing family toxin [Candidatus Poribacteria bacterium]|nr:type II toxin-antitoxin system death-on-curing family toxin [Candidatus Poribacteria bacterium]